MRANAEMGLAQGRIAGFPSAGSLRQAQCEQDKFLGFLAFIGAFLLIIDD